MAVKFCKDNTHVYVPETGDVIVTIDKSLAEEMMEFVLGEYDLNTSSRCIREAWEREIGIDSIIDALNESMLDKLDINASANDWPDYYNELQCQRCGNDLRKYGVIQNADSFFTFNSSGNTISFKSHGGSDYYCASCGNKLDLDELGIEII